MSSLILISLSTRKGAERGRERKIVKISINFIDFGIKQCPSNLCLVYLWRAKRFGKVGGNVGQNETIWDKCDFHYSGPYLTSQL